MTVLKSAPEGAKVIDLDQFRKVRAEVRDQAGVAASLVKLAAGYVPVKAEIPLEATFLFQEGKLRPGLESMLEDPADVDALLADGLTAQDLSAIITFLNEQAGEALASS